ncbi:tetratricopeptide repeat protein [Thermodesulfobacteriota bacterium]
MSSMNEKWESKLAILSNFYRSDTEKIYLLIDHEEPDLYRFLNDALESASKNEENRIFQYEIWKGEHSRHFLFRWLCETVFGHAFKGFGSWTEMLADDPQLARQLQLLIEQDIRPLEIRFLEAIRFLSRKLASDQRLILAIVARTGLDDKILVDFFRNMLNVLPVHVKMLLVLQDQDAPVKQSDFSPSNRLVLEGIAKEAKTDIETQYTNCCQGENIKGQIIQMLDHLVHPADLELLSAITGESTNALNEILSSAELENLIEQFPENYFRLAYPRLVSDLEIDSPDFSEADKKVVEFLETRMSNHSDYYPDALFHSLGLSRLVDADFIASRTLAAYPVKISIGGGDICEYELDRVLDLIGDKKDGLRATLLLTLGEIQESRQRNHEAIQALEAAIEIFSKTGNKNDLQRALEIKGRAAFSIRETDTAKEALEESLRVSREMDRVDLAADILSQLAYLHYSLKQLREAENLYQESLSLYQNISKTDETAGFKGEAAQWANLGHTNYAQGDFQKAEENHREALQIYESLENLQAQAKQWGFLGHTFFAKHDFEQAIAAYEKAAGIEEQLGEPRKAAQRHANVGHTLYAQRKVELATQSFQKALEKYRDLGDPEGQAAQLANLGITSGDQGEFEEALTYFSGAAQLHKELGDEVSESSQIVKMGHVQRARKHYDEAIDHYKDALNRYQTLKYMLGEGNTELDLGQLYSEKEAYKTLSRLTTVQGWCLKTWDTRKRNLFATPLSVMPSKLAGR